MARVVFAVALTGYFPVAVAPACATQRLGVRELELDLISLASFIFPTGQFEAFER
jgi:hypothetical protein